MASDRRRGQLSDRDWPRLRAYLLVILLAFLLLAGRLFYLQVIEGRTLMKQSLDNLFETVKIAAPRGEILDRKGRALAKNESSFALLYLMPENIDSYFLSRHERQVLLDFSSQQLAQLAQLNQTEYDSALAAARQALGLAGDTADPLLLAQTARQRELLRGVSNTKTEFLRDLRIRDLQNLVLCTRNPGLMRGEVVSALRRSGEQPFIYKWHVQDGEQPGELKEVRRIATYLRQPYADLMKRLEREKVRAHRYEPVTLVDELDENQRIYIAEHNSEYPSMMVEDYAFRRVYPLGPACGSILGYLGYPDENDPKKLTALVSGQRDMIGKQGAERAFELLLHGRAGQRDLEVTKANAIKDIAREKAPKRGTDIFLSLDMGVQALAHRLLGGRPGAIVISVLEPGHEGELLALASSPTYDPSRLNDIAYVDRLNKDPNKPFANRAYALTAPPGSTFKIVTTQAALQTKAITIDGYRSYCKGWTEIGEQRYNCHHETGHGSLNLIESFANSCDIAFYDIGTHKLKGDAPARIKHFGELFSYGSPVGIELPGEVSGLLPDKEWKRRTFDKPQFNKWDRMWFDGNTANYAIGQGDLLATPLQVLWSANTVALDGRVYKPRLLIATQADGSKSAVEAEDGRNVPLDKEALAFVKRAMRFTVTNGTCRKLNLSGMQVAAKSGTAEAGRGKADHSWVVGFYPYDKPRYSFVAYFQNGGSAGEAAIPAMYEMLRYLDDNDPLAELDKQKEKQALTAQAR